MVKKMKRIIKGAAAFVLVMSVMSSGVYAAKLSYYGEDTSLEVTGEKQNVLHFEGKLDGIGTNRIATLIIMKPGKSISDISDKTAVAHMEAVSVNYDGSFEYKFAFGGESGIYRVYVISDDIKYESEYNYKSWEDVRALFEKIRGLNVVYSDIADYSDTLGLDISKITNDGYKDTSVLRIKAAASRFTDSPESIKVLKDVFANVDDEIAELSKIKSAENWSYIPAVLEKLTSITGVEYSYRGASRQAVCQKIMGNDYASAETVKAAFDKAVTEALAGNGGTGGGTGGGGGGGSVTGGGSGGNYITGSNTDNKNTNIKNNDSNAFSDISGLTWAVKPINYLYGKGIINGIGDGKFAPDDALKREEIVKIITLAFGLEETDEKSGFLDVYSGAWYESFIARAKKAGVVSGISDDLFGVGENVTRQDIAVMIYNAAVLSGKGFSKQKTEFTDYADVSDYAKKAVAALAGEGVINGFEDNSFRPFENATRAQAAKMIYTVLGGDK